MKVIVVISGWTQKKHQNTGSRQLWHKLLWERDLCATKDATILFREWNSDWKAEAKFINSLNPSEVLVCCYSWGGGFGMPQLSKRLQCDVSVVACDPVYRSPTPFGRWMAFCDHKIKLPDNVKVVGWVSQESKWYELDGDLLVGKDVCDEQVLDYTHTEIDNSLEYHQLAVLAAKNYLQG